MKSNKTAKVFGWLGALSILSGSALFFAASTLATPMISFDITPRPVANTVATIHHLSGTLIVVGGVLGAVAFLSKPRHSESAQRQ